MDREKLRAVIVCAHRQQQQTAKCLCSIADWALLAGITVELATRRPCSVILSPLWGRARRVGVTIFITTASFVTRRRAERVAAPTANDVSNYEHLCIYIYIYAEHH